LKLTSSKPAKYAETIGKRKFVRLSSSRQHEYLAFLARETLKTGDVPGFLKRYNEMQSWIDLDRYNPPDYLTGEEALHEYFLFHNSFTGNPQNGLGDESQVPDKEAVAWKPGFDVTIVLDQVRSPYNVGSVLRLIDNFGFRRLVHNSDWLRLDHPQLCKSARGCQKWIPVELKLDLVHWLNNEKLPVIGLETSPEAVDIDKWQPEKACVLLLGNEAYGIADELRNSCTTLVKIPMFGFKKSMNLHHALAITGHKITASAS
jgi:TrmH family RNA methyltransferase